MHFLLFQHTAARRRLLIVAMFFYCLIFGFNTQPRGGGCNTAAGSIWGKLLFQHTAARRRLHNVDKSKILTIDVSTHSRAEAAAPISVRPLPNFMFQHTAARRRLPVVLMAQIRKFACFNTQPRGGGCSLHKKVRKISELNTVFR